MRVQNANEARDDFERYGRALHAVVAKNLDLFWRPAGTCEETASPTIGRVRGRIVAFECAPPQFGLERIDGRQWAVPWHGNRSLLLQDDWDGPEIAMKLEEIRRLLRPAPIASVSQRTGHQTLQYLRHGVPPRMRRMFGDPLRR